MTKNNIYQNQLNQSLKKAKLTNLIDRVQPNTMEVSYLAGDIILKEGENDSSAYRILEGTVEVISKGHHGKVELARFSEGAIFGEMSLIDRKPRSATVKAISNVRLIRIVTATYEQELLQASPVIQELMLVFSNRLRKTDQSMVTLSDAEKQQRNIAELNREELTVISHIAQTGVCLQNVFAWNESYKIIEDSLLKLGFKELKLHIESGIADCKDAVKIISQEKIGEYYELCFHGSNQTGKLVLFAPDKKLKDRYQDILTIYKGLLSSCLAKSEIYDALINISRYVENYISDTRIQDIANDFKKAIELFSNRNLDVLMAIPDRLRVGEKIEDITFEMTMGFQEIDRLVQEVDLIRKVFDNILQITKGQLTFNISSRDKYIDEIGSQSVVDDIISGENIRTV